MTTGATGQLGLALPVQGELSGTWGDTVNNGITEYTNIAIAATLTLTNDGAVTLANTTGDASASNITSSLTGAGTVTAQFAIVKITGTLTTTKVVTAPSYSKTYTVVNAATGGTVTFKASGQTGVSIAVGESAFVYYNGTDYVKVATTTSGTGDVVGPASATANGIALFNSTTGKLIKDSAASDGLIYGLTVGRGAGAVSTNTAVGASALAGSNSGTGRNTGLGWLALTANTTGTSNTAVGVTLNSNTTGSYNTSVGDGALNANTTASNNTAVGYQAGYSNQTGARNTIIGYLAGYNLTGSFNTLVGSGTSSSAGDQITSGTKNTVLGAYNGNQNSLDIRTASNYVVLSDGDGNPRMYFDANGIANLRSSMLEQMTISATAATGTINFDAATQSVLYYTTNASGNFTMNIRGNSGTTLNNSMATGQSLTVAFLCTNGSTAYYQSAMTIDGSSVTPKWQGGTAPTTGNASAIDSYVYTIIKTASATFTVLASQTKFA